MSICLVRYRLFSFEIAFKKENTCEKNFEFLENSLKTNIKNIFLSKFLFFIKSRSKKCTESVKIYNKKSKNILDNRLRLCFAVSIGIFGMNTLNTQWTILKLLYNATNYSCCFFLILRVLFNFEVFFILWICFLGGDCCVFEEKVK